VISYVFSADKGRCADALNSYVIGTLPSDLAAAVDGGAKRIEQVHDLTPARLRRLPQRRATRVALSVHVAARRHQVLHHVCTFTPPRHVITSSEPMQSDRIRYDDSKFTIRYVTDFMT